MDDYFDNQRRVNTRKQQKQKAVENAAKYKIKRKARISVETATVGALADFEKEFGYLWAHGKNYNSLTEREKEMRELWLDVRSSVLDRCENSKKILLREIDRCVITEYEDRYVTIIKGDTNNGKR